MMINSTSGSETGTAGSSSQAARMDDGMGRDVFLKLLITQLTHQDPLRPKDDGEFLAQLAQFSSLEKLSEISASIKAIGELLVEQRAEENAS